ncbi:ABC-F family ATP-binding cassette domain-containing protein [Halosquirtibacter laminarini]|uniref:ABC-F family ATP-binding cassette domain-containing protein n=1 Tax=Halosquirtibacter laminarini TaxID=3374600 RepID=A0AC61NL56_9BACT|nr:ABC-F family ATP-binding cassette domain-containing protein [Prolixibacteraceae bacterium]
MIPYIEIENVTKRWGEQILFENISFNIAKGQKVAIIAKNGAGKSTLLNAIARKTDLDDGVININKDVKVGYLSQVPELNENLTVIEQATASDNPIAALIRNYEMAISSNNTAEMEALMEEMNLKNAWDFELRFKQILSELKINNFNQKVSQLSGGQQKRVALAQILINEPDMLILDEPTNHLDLKMIEWLEIYLTKTNCTLLMVTHDRYFLDRVCNEIIEIEDNTTYRYKGNYSYYLQKRDERIAIKTAEIEKAKNLYKTELDWLRRMPKARGHKAKYRVDAAHELKKKATQTIKEDKLDLQFESSRLGNKIIEVSHLEKAFDDIIILKDFSYKFAKFEKIGIVGKNGTGKSTLLNMLTGQIPADSGEIEVGQTIKFGYYTQTGMNFKEEDRVIDIIKEIAEVIDLGNGRKWTASQFLTYFLFPPETQYTYVRKLSGGEKRRLYLCTVLMQNPNFLILDEPTNDLDIMTLNVLEQYLSEFQGCVIVVSHDRYFMDKIVDHLFVFEGEGQIKDFPGNYTHFRQWEKEQEKEKKAIEKKTIVKEEVPVEKPKKVKRSYHEQKEFDKLPKEIEKLEVEKKEIEEKLNDPSLSSDQMIELSQKHAEVTDTLDEKELRWLELSEKQ